MSGHDGNRISPLPGEPGRVEDRSPRLTVSAYALSSLALFARRAYENPGADIEVPLDFEDTLDSVERQLWLYGEVLRRGGHRAGS